MHFTLGTMSLEAKEEDELEAPAADSAQSSKSASNQQPEHTLEAATKVLNDIKEDVKALLHGEKLCVSLDSMDIMRPEKGNPERAHVMWVGPTPGANNDRFVVVASTFYSFVQTLLSLSTDFPVPCLARIHPECVQGRWTSR